MRNLISETKVNNTFPVSQFCVPGYLVNLLLKKKLKPLLLKIICVRLSGYWSGDFNVQVSDIKLDTFCSYGI